MHDSTRSTYGSYSLIITADVDRGGNSHHIRYFPLQLLRARKFESSHRHHGLRKPVVDPNGNPGVSECSSGKHYICPREKHCLHAYQLLADDAPELDAGRAHMNREDSPGMNGGAKIVIVRRERALHQPEAEREEFVWRPEDCGRSEIEGIQEIEGKESMIRCYDPLLRHWLIDNVNIEKKNQRRLSTTAVRKGAEGITL
ncbi:hypothetical protein C8R43DRAFT_1110392 [Mycena crocata]|nr:hypothetical protein C8R43DRAFT_1110392 [Mycena crocata]